MNGLPSGEMMKLARRRPNGERQPPAEVVVYSGLWGRSPATHIEDFG